MKTRNTKLAATRNLTTSEICIQLESNSYIGGDVTPTYILQTHA